MPDFKVGDKAVYIFETCPEYGLFKGKIYPILGVYPCCPTVTRLDVGVTFPQKYIGMCTICNSTAVTIDHIDSKYFIPLEDFTE